MRVEQSILPLATFTTNGVTHVELEERYNRALKEAYKKGKKDALKEIKVQVSV